MVERYLDFLGEADTIKLLKANELPLITSIRVNSLKIQSLELKKRLELKGFVLEPIEWVPYGFNIAKKPLNLGSLHEFLQGYFYLQNVASMLPAIILNPQPNDLVIDMCASPGSKATQLAQIMKNEGKLILIERNKRRIPALEINLRRMGVNNSIVLNFDSKNLERLNVKAEKILLDAPCSGEGLIREDIARKKSKTIEDIAKMASVQKKLLRAGLASLTSGGSLLYSTCSIAPEENEIVIDDVLKSFSKCSVIKIEKQYGVSGLTTAFESSLRSDLEFSQRLYPHIHDTIGFYFCLIKKFK